MRVVSDSMGEMQIPEGALWGASTQRALANFQISGQPMPKALIAAVAEIKAALASAHAELGLLDPVAAGAIVTAAARIVAGEVDDAFPIDVFQTGSGTSTNMNVNEVIAHLAAEQGVAVHPNDHVNLGQSSNDVIPSAIQMATLKAWQRDLEPALQSLQGQLQDLAMRHADSVKTGRTHLMDATPMTFGQEFRTFSLQIEAGIARLRDSAKRVALLPLGGTAIGTGLNADPRAAALACAQLNSEYQLGLAPLAHAFVGIAAKDELVEFSGQLNTLACTLMKLANDLRWMNSGPLSGLGEIALRALQPGSSIMPGKVNPVVPEAVAMVCAQVMGNQVAITIAGQSGNFQLNVMLPLLARNMLESVALLAGAAGALCSHGLPGLTVNKAAVAAAVERNPMLVTALNPVIGYARAAAIAQRAYQEGRAIVAVAAEETGMSEAALRQQLDPMLLTGSRKNTPQP